MDWKRYLNLFRFWHSIVNSTAKWMLKWPDIVYRLVGKGAYARMASEGGTYCSVNIRLPSNSGVPRHLRVGKVGLKVSHDWLSMQD